ncbi:hypothetical protein [Paenibacillus sp. FSL K6-1230]|uniref:hypothetical protein n=1 Tax=Paenibacillus sp. FSL K6-1230 TaxID=2921603 RepID=UPI0030F6CCBE
MTHTDPKHMTDDQLRKELEEARKETGLARLAYEGLQEECVSRGEYESLLNKYSALSRSLHEAQQTIAIQKRTLKFYANKNNYVWSHTYDETGEVEEIPSKIWRDRGDLALKALGE